MPQKSPDATYVAEVTRPVLCSLTTLDSQINQNLQILLGENFASTRFVDVGFGFAVRQELKGFGVR
jgi:hypothetical protein